MSGGSYNYLYGWPDRAGIPTTQLAEMAMRAHELAPDSPGAVALHRLWADAANLELRWRALHEVMHDIEWVDSGDYLPEEAVSALRGWKSTP